MGEGSGVAGSCGVGCRRGLDLMLLWLWRRLVATGPIRPLAWEPPYAAGVALEKAKRQKKKKLPCYKKCLIQGSKPMSIVPGLFQVFYMHFQNNFPVTQINILPHILTRRKQKYILFNWAMTQTIKCKRWNHNTANHQKYIINLMLPCKDKYFGLNYK